MASGPNVGFATLSVIPALRGVREELERQLEDPLKRSAARAGSEAADELQSAFASTELVDNPDRLFAGVDAAAGRAGADAADELSAASSEFRAAGERLSDAAGSSFDLSPAAAEAAGELSRRLDSERGNVSAAGEQLGRAAGDGVEDGLRTADVSGVGRDIGLDAGEGVGSGVLDGVGDLSGGLEGILGGALGGLPAVAAGPALAVGAAVGGSLIKGFSDALEQGQIESRIQAGLGVSNDEAARLGAIAGEIYRDNWGDSVANVGESIRLTRQIFGDLGATSEAELQQVATAALATADVFDQDLRGSIRAAATLIRTGLVDDSTEAFDLITVGLQSPANAADDLLDTFTEYPTLFRNLGLEGEEALGLLSQALAAGARDSDRAADALKEFSIRAVDGSKATAEGYELIGLSAEEMAVRVAAGGTSARDALQETLEGLRGIEDPVARTAAAVALFGTQAEDLGEALFALDLDTAAQELGDIEDASQGVIDGFDDVGSSISTVRRELEGVFSRFADRTLDPFADFLEIDEPGLADVGRTAWNAILTGFGENRDPIAAILDEAFGGVFGDLFNTDDFVSDLDPAIGTVGKFTEGLGFAAIATREVGDESADAAPKVAEFGGEIVAAGEQSEFFAGLVDIAGQRVSDFADALDGGTNVDTFLGSTLDLRDAFGELGEAAGELRNVDISDVAFGLVDVSDEAADALRDVLGAADDVRGAVALALEFGGAEAARQKAADIREELRGVFTEAGLSQEQIEELFTVIGVDPRTVDIAIEVSGTEEAIAKLTLVNSFLDREDAPVVPVEIQAEIARLIAEDDLTAASNLLTRWYADVQDGLIDDPLLVAFLLDTDEATSILGEWFNTAESSEPPQVPVAADTSPADGDLSEWKIFVQGQRTDTQVGANTIPGRVGVDEFGRDTEGKRFDIVIDADLTPAQRRVGAFINSFPVFGLGFPGGNIPGLAGGGPVTSGDLYMVGENEPELFMSDRAGRILNQEQIRDEFAGGSAGPTAEVQLNYSVTEARERPRPEDLLRVTRSALFRSGVEVVGAGIR